MSKRMSKFLMYWTLLVLVQIYGYLLYQYDQTYGFDETINPAIIFIATLVLIGCLGLIGRYLEHKDIERGYCESGITQKRIDTCQKSKNRETREHTDEDDDDSQR